MLCAHTVRRLKPREVFGPPDEAPPPVNGVYEIVKSQVIDGAAAQR